MFESIRLAEATDLNTLVALMQEFYSETATPFSSAQTAQAFELILNNSALGRVWVLGRQEAIVGYAVLTIGFSMEFGGRDAFLDDLFVQKEHRGFGLGKKAMAEIMGECRKQGVRAVHLEVDQKNAAAKELYRRFGFVDHDRQLLTVIT